MVLIKLTKALPQFAIIVTLLPTCSLTCKHSDSFKIWMKYRHWPSRGSWRELFSAPIVIDDRVLAQIRALRDYAPLHNPVEADCIAIFRKMMPWHLKSQYLIPHFIKP
jgi:hypothetical protein